MTPSSCAVSSLNSLITTETLINLSAFFFPRHERWGDFFSFFANLCLLISFHRRQGPVSSCWPFFFSCFQYHKAAGWLDCSQTLTMFGQIWKRKIMQKHRLQKRPPQMSDPDYLHLLRDHNFPAQLPVILASLLYQFGEMQKGWLQQE